MRKSARASLALIAAASATLAAASAFPVSTPPPGPASTPTSAPAARTNELPFDSSLIFVLDDTIASNGSRRGDLVRAHLKNALKIGEKIVAAAGAPAKIRILDAESAKSGDVYGYVNIFFMPLQLADGRDLPLRAPTSHLTVYTTAGHEATVATEDTIGDIFIPYHVLYHAFRKGRNFVLGAGSEIRARTQATVTLTANGAVAISTPEPISIDLAAPHSTFPERPMVTPRPNATRPPNTPPPLRPDAPPLPGATP